MFTFFLASVPWCKFREKKFAAPAQFFGKELIRIYLIGSKVFIFENLKKVVNHSILQYNKLRPEAGALNNASIHAAAPSHNM